MTVRHCRQPRVPSEAVRPFASGRRASARIVAHRVDELAAVPAEVDVLAGQGGVAIVGGRSWRHGLRSKAYVAARAKLRALGRSLRSVEGHGPRLAAGRPSLAERETLGAHHGQTASAAVSWIGANFTPCVLVYTLLWPVCVSRTVRTTLTFVSPPAKTQ